MSTQNNNVSKPLTWIAGGLALGAGAVALSAARSGLSIRGKIVASGLVPLLRRGKRLQNADTLDAAIADNRTAGPALPPNDLYRRFVIEEEVRHGTRTFTVSPRSGATGAKILYLPGGAYTFQIIPAHWTLIAGLIDRSGATVVVALYPLAPENTWKEAFASVTALYRDLKQKKGRDSLFVGGDSAGGGLALALAQEWHANQIALPEGLLLFSPFCDGTVSDPEQSEIARADRMLKIDGAREAAKRWAGDLPLNDRRVSPLFGSLTGLPPLLVISGAHDILYSDANRLHERAVAERATIEIHRYPSMFHVFMAVRIPEGRRALEQAAAFIKRISAVRAMQ